jgi:2-oxoisovalerate dehydrogenase E1 component
MPKSLSIDPDEVRRPGTLPLAPIPVNAYQRTLAEERTTFTDAQLTTLLHDMALIRAFESLLHTVKTQRTFGGIAYDHRGPAHLSIGQEATAVGQAFLLDADDHIYGSHRSHGEILAKGLSAIRTLPDTALVRIMESWGDGRTLRAIERDGDGGGWDTVQDQARDFLLYGALAEIFGRETGFNRGMGGSMHAFFPPLGIYPNNAIVGGSADIAVGAALYKRVNRKPGIVIANIGDASASCGPVWEALCFASMAQFATLWDESVRGGLPVLFHFVNNFYGMGGQPVGETGGFGILARLGAGLNAAQLHAERIDGYSPLAVIDAIRRKKALLESGAGPVLLDTITYRFSGHSPSDASSYREKSEIDAWRQVDPLETFARQLADAGVLSSDARAVQQEGIDAAILRAYRGAVDLDVSPRADLRAPGNLLERTTFSDRLAPSLDPSRTSELRHAHADNPRIQRLAEKSRTGLGADGTPLPKSRCIGIRDALFEAIVDAFETDPTLIAYGEENRDWGGAFGVYQGLTERLPYHRLFNAPIAEAAIVGTAVGYGLEGGRALVELMYCDFLGRAGDEIFNQLAKWQAMSGGTLTLPVVVRVSVGSKYGAQHSQDWTALCAHIPGLKVVFPATPTDAKGLLAAALQGTDPVIFFESQRLYDQPELFCGQEGVPIAPFTLPLGAPVVRRTGCDLTIVTIGATLYRALDAAQTLERDFGLSAEVIDARSLVPFDYAPLVASVEKTGRLLFASDACARGSFLQTLAADMTRLAFDALDGPPVVVGARNAITPPDELETDYFPFADDLLDAIHSEILPLPGYTPKRAAGPDELLRRSRQGI